MKKNQLSKLALCILCSAVIAACAEDDNAGEMYTPEELLIDGPAEVGPTDTATYFANVFSTPESYSWTVPDGATIVGDASESSITVAFSATGDGDITVSARGVNGTKTIDVVANPPMASLTLDEDIAALSGGQTANVIINYDQDIDTAPEVMLMPYEGSTSGVTSVEQVGPRTFQFSYSAGAGDGNEAITVSNAVSTGTYGAVAQDSVFSFDLYDVDNTPATGELLASRTPVTDSTTVTLSALFSEPLSTTDSVQVSIVGADTAYVTEATMMTEDGITWTYEFQPGGGNNETATVSVSNLPSDLAGNPTTAVAPIVLGIRND